MKWLLTGIFATFYMAVVPAHAALTAARYEFTGNSRASFVAQAGITAGAFADGSGFSGSFPSVGNPAPCIEVDGAETANSASNCLSQSKYYTFTMTPDSDVMLKYKKLTFNAQSKYANGGHRIYVALYWSVDNYSTQLGYHTEATTGTSDSNFADLHEMDLSTLKSQFGTVTFRIVVWDGTDWNAKAARLDNVTLLTSIRETTLIEAVDDNQIRGGTYADTVQYTGSGSTIYIKLNSNISYQRKGYARFDFSGVDTADAEEPAILTIRYAGDGEGDGTGCWLYPYALKADFTQGSGVLGTGWQESAITWNNAPANQISGKLFTSDAESIKDGGFWWVEYAKAAGTQYTTTINRLGDYIQADGSVTILFTPGEGVNNRAISLTSSENTTYVGPELRYVIKIKTGTKIILR